MGTVRVVDCGLGRRRVIVMRQIHLSQPYEERLVAHPEETAASREATAGRTVDNRRADVIGRGRVVRRLPATRTLPPRADVLLD